MIGKRHGAMFLAVLATNICSAQPNGSFETSNSGQNEIPGGIKISLESNKTNYFLGENVLLYYRIDNAGSNTFKISVGGDYRGSTRADRFKVTATSTDGKPVIDPTPVMRNFGGGLMPNSEIKPGGDWFENVHVIEYCRFDEPGSYTIHVFHDLGFGKMRETDLREVSITINLQAPTEEQARTILVEDETAKPYHGNTWGQKGESRLDYHCIRWPTFLQPLIERAQNGRQDAVEGIASIRTLEATRALANLLGHTNFAIAQQSATLLEWRTPHSTNEFQGPWGEMRKQYYIENVWDKKFAAPLLDFSLQLLARKNHNDFILATKFLGRVGTQHEVPALMKALEFAVKQTNAEFLADIHYPSPIRASDTLLGAAMMIDQNLSVSANEIKTPGQALLFIAKHSGNDRVFSKEDEAAFAQLLRHKLPYVRMKALENLPKEIPQSLSGLVMERMTDSNAGVRGFAFEVARRMQEPRHGEIALAVLKTADDQWLRWSAHDIALKYGARYECAMVWVSHLVAPKNINDYTPHDAIQHLFEIIVGKNTSGNLEHPHDAVEAQTMQEHWKKFLIENKDKIEAGHEFLKDEVPDNLGMRF
jgi:hypothetical protein